MERKILAIVAVLFVLSAPPVMAQQLEPCYGDFDCDGDVMQGDIPTFKANMGRFSGYKPCPPPQPVCTCTGTLSPLGRWCDQNNGTVKDMTTGLVWLKDAGWGGAKTWEDCTNHDDAHTRAGILATGMAGLSDGSGGGEWRLPTYTDLYGVLVGTEGVRSTQMFFFFNVIPGLYWTSTTTASFPDTAFVWSMTGYGASMSKSADCFVWPVRRDND